MIPLTSMDKWHFKVLVKGNGKVKTSSNVPSVCIYYSTLQHDLRNEFDFRNVQRIMNTLGPLQSK